MDPVDLVYLGAGVGWWECGGERGIFVWLLLKKKST